MRTYQQVLSPKYLTVMLKKYRTEVNNMKHILVKFGQADQIINFVRITNRFGRDADMKCGNRMVDTESTIGVSSLAKSKTVKLIPHTDDCDQLMEEIALFAA